MKGKNTDDMCREGCSLKYMEKTIKHMALLCDDFWLNIYFSSGFSKFL